MTISASSARWTARWIDRNVLASPWTGALGIAAAFVIGSAALWLEAVADFFGKHQPFWVREDFTAFYAAGQLASHGLGAKIYSDPVIAGVEHLAAGRPVGGTGMLPYFNPPFFALPFAPLSHLSLQQAYQVWLVASLLLVTANCVLIWRLSSPLAKQWRVVVLVGYLTLYPLLFGLRLGQFSLILELSIALGFICLRDGHERLAGASFSLLLIKPELVVPIAIYAAVTRRWRVFITLAPVTVAAVVASVAVAGIHESLSYPAYLLHSTTENGPGVGPRLMINWSGIAAATFGNGGSELRPIVAGVFGVAVLALFFARVSRRPRHDNRPFATEWLALVTAVMLADPHFYLQDTIIAVPVAVAAVASMDEAGRAVGGIMLVSMWGLARLALYPNESMHVDLLAIGFGACLCVALWWLKHESPRGAERAIARLPGRLGAARRNDAPSRERTVESG